MPTQAQTRNLAELHDEMQAAVQERHDRERAEQAQRQLLRRTQSKLQKVEAEITKTRADEDTKLQTVVMLRERLEGVEELNLNDPEVRDERLALVEAIGMAMEKGAPVTSGINCPSNAREYRLLFDAAPRGTAWSVPLNELQRRREALTAERSRLQARLDELEEDIAVIATPPNEGPTPRDRRSTGR